MTIHVHVDITDIILLNFGPHFHFWHLKNSRCHKCHALEKIKGALENKINYNYSNLTSKKVQVGKDQEKAQSEKDSHSKNRGGKKQN